tara:strand:- start:4573 stop:5958 length:1386 start_codon:yes stop_codon:yes gene_type:complete
MKGTLISNDFVKDRNGDLKFLEMNTDTVLYGSFLKHDADWTAFTNFLNSESHIDTLHLIYKAELHHAAVEDIKFHVTENCSGVTTITTQAESLHNSFPTAVEDAENKFILRLAYDENAILDSFYAASGINPLALLEENNSGSLAIPFYSVDGGTVTSTLVSSSNAVNIPDAVYKPKDNVFGELKFSKVGNWETAKTNLTGSYYLTNYETHADDIAAGFMKTYRNYGIAYGGGLTYIDLGTVTTPAIFDIPTAAALDWDGSSNWDFPIKHRLEYSTSTWKATDDKHGVFEVETFTSASGASVGFGEGFIGQELKAFHVPGLPDTEDPAIYLAWSLTGSNWPVGTAITTSIAQAVQHTNQNLSGELFSIEAAGEKFYLGGSSSVLAHDYVNDKIKYVPIVALDNNVHTLLDTTGSAVPITKAERIQLSVPTGSFFSVNIEENDNIMIGSQAFAFVSHNFRKQE